MEGLGSPAANVCKGLLARAGAGGFLARGRDFLYRRHLAGRFVFRRPPRRWRYDGKSPRLARDQPWLPPDPSPHEGVLPGVSDQGEALKGCNTHRRALRHLLRGTEVHVKARSNPLMHATRYGQPNS